VCRYLKLKGTSHLIVEASFVAKAFRKQDNEDPAALKNSHKYRQFVAVGKFVAVLKHIAVKYAIVVDTHEAINTTRICHHCNHLNASTEKETFSCEGCHKVLNQDQNAAINLSRFGRDPELAKMALHAGKAA
jgi:transposase